MSPPGRRRRRELPRRAAGQAGALAATVLLAIVLLPGRARGETTITTQASADDGAFLPYAPPPAQPAGLCLVDTGVDLNPDTEASVVERTSIDSGEGEDLSPTKHGTIMAMMAAAPANGWGMVGTAPGSIRVVSVGILEAGKTTFPFRAYAAGITTCLERQEKFDIRVINLSLGTSEVPSSESYEALANSINEATDYGIAVVAAAGNDSGGPVEYPAAYPGVLSVGAANALSGEWCSFSNRGEGLRLIAPGCDLDAADPLSGTPNENYFQGSSEASAITAAALTSLEAYAPTLNAQEAEQDLTTADDGMLDIAQAFRDAGLASIVSAGEAAEPRPVETQTPPSTPKATPPEATPQATPEAAPAAPETSVDPPSLPHGVRPSSTMTLTAHLSRPRARLRRDAKRWRLVLHGRPAEAQVQVRYLRRKPHEHKLQVASTRRGSFEELRLPVSGIAAVSVRYTDPDDLQRDSPWVTLKLPASSHGHRHKQRRPA